MHDRQVITDGRQSTYIIRSIRSGDELPSPAKGAGQLDLFLEGHRQRQPRSNATEVKRNRDQNATEIKRNRDQTHEMTHLE